MGTKCIGVDLGGTTTKFGLLDREGQVEDKWEIPTRKEDAGSHILSDIAESILKKLKDKGIDKEDIIGVGVGVPGPVGNDGKLTKCVNLGWFEPVYPEKTLSEMLGGIPVKAGNDANVAALGELWKGGGAGYKNAVFFTLGTGVGGGVVVDGRMIAGSFGMGGEVGHITVNPHEPDACNCGNHGCLEQYASATGIVKQAQRALAKSDRPSVLRDMDGFTCKDVLDAAKDGDALAAESVEGSMRYLALVMSFASHITDPEVFIIGGGVSKAGVYLTDMLKRLYAGYIYVSDPQAEVALASLGNDAGMYGAARLVL